MFRDGSRGDVQPYERVRRVANIFGIFRLYVARLKRLRAPAQPENTRVGVQTTSENDIWNSETPRMVRRLSETKSKSAIPRISAPFPRLDFGRSPVSKSFSFLRHPVVSVTGHAQNWRRWQNSRTPTLLLTVRLPDAVIESIASFLVIGNKRHRAITEHRQRSPMSTGHRQASIAACDLRGEPRPCCTSSRRAVCPA